MQLVTYDFIMSLYPCYDPIEIRMPTDYNDTPVNFITNYRSKAKNKSDIQWVLLREEFLTHKEILLFVIWCARQVHHLIKDPRSIKALDVTEAYINGTVTKEELEIAKQNADDAAFYAAVAAFYAVRAAAGVAVNYAADAVNYADAAENVQIDKLLEIFKEKQNENILHKR